MFRSAHLFVPGRSFRLVKGHLALSEDFVRAGIVFILCLGMVVRRGSCSIYKASIEGTVLECAQDFRVRGEEAPDGII